ncbi:MAG: hypothetical protein SPL43_00545 [Prevotella sp.]|nr:hypothetical protein [Prevotella sp.]
MKKNLHAIICLALMTCTVSVMGGTPFKKGFRPSAPIATLGFGTGQHSTLLMPGCQNKVLSPAAMLRRTQNMGTYCELDSIPLWGYLTGPDQSDWLWAETVEEDGYNYKSATITIYDNHQDETGKITVNVAPGVTVNQIEPFGLVTGKFFDHDDKNQEVPVYIHSVDNNHNSIDSIFVYRLNGDLVKKYRGYAVAMFDASPNSWDAYQRLLIAHEDTIKAGDSTQVMVKVDVYKQPSWGQSEPQLEHSFALDPELTNYSDGPYVTAVNMGDGVNYVTAHYAKPYMKGYDEQTWEPIVNTDNHFIIDVYNQKYDSIAHLELPLEAPSNSLYRFAAFGLFPSDNLTKGMFSGDDDLNAIVTFYDYQTATDNYVYTYQAFNSKGECVKTLASQVNMAIKMADIEGQHKQYCFLETVDGAQRLRTVDLPECNDVTIFPSAIGDFKVSTNIERYPDAQKGYEYAIGNNAGLSDSQGNVIGQIGWWTKEGTLDKTVDFNMGTNAEYFTPNISSIALNPYLVNTNEEHEYMYLARIKREDSNVKDAHLVITDGQGNALKSVVGNDSTGAIRSVNLMNTQTAEPTMMVAYEDKNDNYHLSFYALPFIKFEKGGTGTAADPYQIASRGDLEQVVNAPDNNYVVVNDIDLGNAYEAWKPIENFTGRLDGQGHALRNLTLTTNNGYSAGLFGTTMGANIKGITFEEPRLELGSGVSSAGVLTASAINDTISDIKVRNLSACESDPDASTAFGAVIGQGADKTLLKNCLIDGAQVSLPHANMVGGVAGQLATSSSLRNCVVKNASLTAQRTLGGIAGATGSDCKVQDCHANAALTADNTIGGVVGESSRGLISRCYSEGIIRATSSSWNGFATGGIVGKLSENWAQTPDTAITACVVALDSIALPQDAEADGTVHRIVGYTIENESDDETTFHEQGLTNNYAAEKTAISIGNDITSDKNGLQGATVAETALTTSFFQNIGFEYGNDENHPWKGDSLPLLFFEDDAPTGITGQLISDEWKLSEGNVSLENATSIRVYTANGLLIRQLSGSAISLTSLPNGLYVIKATRPYGSTQARTIRVRH